MVPKWRRVDVDVTSSRRIDVNTTSFSRHVPAGEDNRLAFYLLLNFTLCKVKGKQTQILNIHKKNV